MFPDLTSLLPPAPFSAGTGRVAPWVAARNMLLDPVFYDVLALGPDERAEIVRASAAGEYHEGGMLLVWPAAARRPVEYFDRSKNLCEAVPDLDSVAVPGVGSSPLGAAAFARQVADVLQRPVVGIIAGHGLADLVSEALGGFFDFGMRNRVQATLRLWKTPFDGAAETRAAALQKDLGLASASCAEDEPDVNTVLNIMLRQGLKLSVLCAHSKGAMVVQRACQQFEKEHTLESETFDHMRIVTFGCAVSLPKAYTNLSQFIGTCDGLGQINTPLALRRDPSVEWVDLKGHNLVARNPIHMPVEEKLEEVVTG